MAKRYRPRDACMTSYGWAAGDGYQSVLQAIADGQQSPEGHAQEAPRAGMLAAAVFTWQNRAALDRELTEQR